MDSPERARLQIRAVHSVFGFEAARLARSGKSVDERREALESLRLRSLEILTNARAMLDGQAAWHVDVLRELDAVRAEIESV
jgi:hypothetical protein